MTITRVAYGDEVATQEQSDSTTHERLFYRCTAQDGSYSFFVSKDTPCPHETDTRRTEHAVEAQAAVEFQEQMDKRQRQLRESRRGSDETEEQYKARMEASQNPFWLQNQEALRVEQERQQAQQASNKAAAERIRMNARTANQFTNTDSHVVVWLGFFAVLAGAIWWLWSNRTPVKPVRSTRRTVSRPSPAQKPMTHKPALLREITPPKPSPPQTSNQVNKLAAYQQVERYLHAFDTNGAMPPMAYFTEIKALNLNYSAESLERLDRFLVELRHRIQPSYTDLVENPQLQQLVIFLGMYLATTIARVTQQSIKWYGYEDIKASDPNHPETLGTLMSCFIGKYHHLPLERICVILYEENSTESCMERLNFFRQYTGVLPAIFKSSLHTVVKAKNDAEQAWFNALSAAGISAAAAMFKIDRGSSLTTTLTVYDPEDNTMKFIVMMDQGTESALEDMKHNPRNVPFKVLAYDCYTDLSTGRINEIRLQIQCYGEFAATWIISIPYRPASHPDGYAFYTPLLASSSVAVDQYPMLMHAFYSGVDSMKLPDDPWNHYLQETDHPAT